MNYYKALGVSSLMILFSVLGCSSDDKDIPNDNNTDESNFLIADEAIAFLLIFSYAGQSVFIC